MQRPVSQCNGVQHTLQLVGGVLFFQRTHQEPSTAFALWVRSVQFLTCPPGLSAARTGPSGLSSAAYVRPWTPTSDEYGPEPPMHLLRLTARLPGATRWGSPTRAIGLQASVRHKEASHRVLVWPVLLTRVSPCLRYPATTAGRRTTVREERARHYNVQASTVRWQARSNRLETQACGDRKDNTSVRCPSANCVAHCDCTE